jgi:hypothetical protein
VIDREKIILSGMNRKALFALTLFPDGIALGYGLAEPVTRLMFVLSRSLVF